MNRKIQIVAATLLSTFSTLVAAENRNVDAPGAVFTMNNSAKENLVFIYDRASDGMLSFVRSVSTGGHGTDVALGNQGGIVLSKDNQWLFVVNAGSHEITSFAVTPTGLEWVDKTDSGGLNPVSISVNRNLLYVVNAGGSAGGSDNITGFTVGTNGHLHAIAGSTRELSAASTGPAQIGFSADGNVLIVTEKNTSLIDTYTVDAQGLPNSHQLFTSPGQEPFGFSFDKRNHLFVTEAPASTISSYEVSSDGTLSIVSRSVQTHQAAACWLAVTKNGRYAYDANAASSSVSGFAIDPNGAITLLNADGLTATTPAGPNDTALSDNSRFLYTLNPSNGTISQFVVGADGSLTSLGNATTVNGADGLAAY